MMPTRRTTSLLAARGRAWAEWQQYHLGRAVLRALDGLAARFRSRANPHEWVVPGGWHCRRCGIPLEDARRVGCLALPVPATGAGAVFDSLPVVREEEP